MLEIAYSLSGKKIKKKENRRKLLVLCFGNLLG